MFCRHYLVFAIFFRAFVLHQKTGINAFAFSTSGPHGIIGSYFKLAPLGSLLVIIIHTFFNDQYSYLAPLHWIEHPLITIIGITLLIISMIWIIVAQSQMGISWRIGIDSIHKTELKTNGLFSLSRNPIFLGMKLNILGFFLTLPNAVTFAILVTGIAIIDIQVSLEEAHLRQLHGSAYDKYANRVGRWITFSHGPRP